MLAASRNERVKGRTIILVVSISTRNGFNQSGAPSGRKCATDDLNDLVNLDNTILNHTGNPIVNVKIKWLDVLNIYGISPNKLIKMIATKIADTRELNPFKWTVLVRESWLKINCTISFIKDAFCDLIIQKDDCINKINITLIHKKTELEGVNELNMNGSKEEKMSGIIQNMGCSIGGFEGF